MRINNLQPLRSTTQEQYFNDRKNKRLTSSSLERDRIYRVRLKLDPTYGCLFPEGPQPKESDNHKIYAADFLINLLDFQPPTANKIYRWWAGMRGVLTLGSVAMQSLEQTDTEEPDTRLLHNDGRIYTSTFVSIFNQPIAVTVEDGYFMSPLDEEDFRTTIPEPTATDRPKPVLVG